VRLTYTDKALGVMVCDNGVASPPALGTGHGLVGIGERVAVVGGDVSFGATAAGGFQLQARLPYALEDA
jgi:signal transduction histidine kinase